MKKALTPLLSKATPDQVKKFNEKTVNQVKKFTRVYDSNTSKNEQMAPSANQSPTPIPSPSTEKECQIPKGNLGSLPVQETSEISWDSEDIPDDYQLTSTQQKAYETFRKSFKNFAL